MRVTKRDGTLRPVEMSKIESHCAYAVEDLDGVSKEELIEDTQIQFFDGIPTSYIHRLLIITAAGKAKVDSPNWSIVAGRLLGLSIYKEVTGGPVEYPHLDSYIEKGVEAGILTPQLLHSSFDFDKLNEAIDATKDKSFTYLGLQTLHSRYLVRDVDGILGPKNALLELPQHFFMRVAMGIALAEKPEERTERALEFYSVYANQEFLNSTPTLFNAGTLRPQLSSCFLLSMKDDVEGIYGTLFESALYSKYSGGIGVDYSPVRPSGSPVASTKGRAGGVIPYMKLLEDTMLGFDQGGKRKGSAAAYLADWHGDSEAFLDILNPAKDHRQTAHDIFPALWVSDLFMKRKDMNENFSLFSADTVPALLTTYGDAFEEVYTQAEKDGLALSVTPAAAMWRRIISKRFEFGKYFVGFKDTINARNPMRKAGIVRSSNLCTEITLNTEPTALSAVCNLGSVNLDKITSTEHLHRVVRTAVRILDNVIEIGLIPHDRGVKHNKQERPIGLGMMGYTDYLYRNGIRFDSQEHLNEANALMKEFSYAAIDASADLAAERGAFPLFEQSMWADGELPHDTSFQAAKDLVTEGDIGYGDREEALREKVKKGMRNSNVMAIAPTATIANILGVTACIELPMLTSYTKSNLNGIFEVVTTLARYVDDPSQIETCRSVDQNRIVESAAVRQIYVDQAQSINLYLPLGRTAKGSEIAVWHDRAWRLGVKTLYYLRGISAEESKKVTEPAAYTEEPQLCSIDNPDCESCQ